MTVRAMLPSTRQMLWGVLIAVLVAAGLLVLAYEETSVPAPNAGATAQTSVVLAADGKTRLATFGQYNRTDVPLSAVPIALQHAVLAAEDRQFYNEPAVSATGTLRALLTDIRGGEIQQGGSTITQQYVKNAFLNQQRTFTRKLKEILIAIKVGQTTSKSQILDDYLNTIYFGRHAYGVKAAAKAYFRKPLGQLSVAQDALLAGVINAPSVDDPRVDRTAAVNRWRYVVGGMVKEGWLSAQQAQALHFPATSPEPTDSGCQGNSCFIRTAAVDELASLGLSQAQIDQGGYRIVTTISPKAQSAAVNAVQAESAAGQLSELTGSPESSMVSIKPGDGAIEAMYAGPGCNAKGNKSLTRCIDTTGVTHLFDPGATDFARPPGSSMKPYTLIAALQHGISLSQVFPGPAEIAEPGFPGGFLHNSGGETCSNPCTLSTALAESINTVFFPLAQQVGPDKVADVAHDAGIPASYQLAPGDSPEVTLGTEPISVVAQADGYATIAAGGVQAAPYLVSEVLDPQGQTVVKHTVKRHRVFSQEVAANAIAAMERVLQCTPVQGTACGHQLTDGRPVAGKTGTATNSANENTQAWFIGFTPQLATAVWVGNQKQNEPVVASGSEVFGGAIPATIWQSMMTTTLAGAPVRQFPTPTQIGVVTPPPSSGSPSTSTSSGLSSPTTSSSSATPPPTSPTTPTAPPSSSTPVPPPAGSSSATPPPQSSG